MSFFRKTISALLPETAKEKIIKHEVKKQLNTRLKLDGELDKHVDSLADKIFDKVDASDVLKAKDMFDKFKAGKSARNDK